MADMIQMVVGDQDGLEGIEGETSLCQVFLESPQADSRIDYDSARSVMEKIAIAIAAAGETHEPQHQFFSSSQYLDITL